MTVQELVTREASVKKDLLKRRLSKLPVIFKSEALYLSARPSKKLNIFLSAENEVVFYPSSSLEITFAVTKQKLFVETDKSRSLYHLL